jgi:hypothetical protein
MRLHTGLRPTITRSLQRFCLALVAGLVLLGPTPLAFGLTSISQSYVAEGNIPVGSIVSVKDNSTDEVIAATTDTASNLIGIVINASNSLLNVSNSQDGEVQIASSGVVEVLASTINGDIEQGDHITASPIEGVGMKATENIRIAGIAQGDLTSSNGEKQTYTDDEGNEQTVVLGQIPILVNISYYFKQPDKTIIPSVLQNLANALAGKDVSSLPIILSSGVFLVMLIVVVSIIYSMIRSSIISVGRNPLSQSAVYRDVIQLSALVIAILAVGIIAIYLILTRL